MINSSKSWVSYGMTRAMSERYKGAAREQESSPGYDNSSILVAEIVPTQMDVDSESEGLLLRIIVATGASGGALCIVDEGSYTAKMVAAPLGRDEIIVRKFTLSAGREPFWLELQRAQLLSAAKNDLGSTYMLDELVDLLGERPITCGLVASLKGEERCIGAILAAWDVQRKFTQKDLQRFEELANQTALTIEFRTVRTQIHQMSSLLQDRREELRRAAAQAEVATAERDRALRYSDIMHSITSISTTRMSTEEGLQEVMGRFIGWVGADTGGTWLVDEGTGEVVPKVIVGLQSAASAWSGMDVKSFLYGEKLTQGEPVVIENAESVIPPVRERGRRKARQATCIRSLLAVPIYIGGRVRGFVAAAWCEHHAFSPWDVGLARVLADRLSIAVESQALSDKLKVFNEELKSSIGELDEIVRYLDALEAVSEVGLSQRGTEEMLSELIKRFVEKLGSDLGAIWMLDEGAGKLVPRASFSGEPVDFTKFLIDAGWGWGGRLVTAGQSLAVEDVGTSPELQEMLEKAVPERSLRAMLAAPLKIQDRVFGAVAVFWLKARRFDPEEIKLLEVTADRAASAIEARRLNESLQASNEELRASNEELRKTTEELARANRAKTEFFNTMSHELRTPMNAIAGYTSLMLRERYGPIAEKQAHALQRIDENSRHLLILINSILDLARLEAGRMPIHYEQVELKEVITESTAVIEPLTKEAKVELLVSIEDNIPVLWTDRAKLKQILLNFLSNAAKFTHKGSIKVFARMVPLSRHVEIAVKDTGVGIKEEDIGLLFEAYSQLDNETNRERAGTGLGLSICKKFAALLGGDIEVRSVYGEGSTFSVTIPCVPAPDAPPSPETYSLQLGAKTVSVEEESGPEG